MRNKLNWCFILFSFVLVSCGSDEEPIVSKPATNIVEYLHISRTREAPGKKIFSEVEGINFKKYDMLWLGGDLTHDYFSRDTIMEYLDSVFDLSNENTLLSMGNHELFPNPNIVLNYTKRPNYYTHHKNGITFVILNTQEDFSKINGDQLAFFNRVIDTISESSHLVVLHHKLIWMYGNQNLQNSINSISNGPLGSCIYCLNPNNFYTDIYPRLIEVKNKGIEVLCLAGDIGAKTDQFEYFPLPGISFVASGLSYDSPTNFGLIFQHDLSSQVLTWKYTLLSQL